MSKNDNSTIVNILQVLIGIVGLAIALILMRFPFPMNLLAIAILIALIAGYYFTNKIKHDRKEKAFRNSFVGQMDEKRQDCLSKIQQLKKELKQIDGNIKDLKEKLVHNPQASTQAKAETEKLVKEFAKEKTLRQSKVEFYELCQTKLNQIVKNHQLTEDLKLKREKLEAIKETNIDEVADMEGMKTFIDYEQTYIETIDTLSLKMLESRSIENAEALQLELVEMTKELHEL